MGTRILVCGLAVVLGVIGLSTYSHAACVGTTNFRSPDGHLTARVVQIGHAGCGESRIAILDEQKHVLASASYRSKDGEHGLGIEQAAWTPDSRFFVFSASSSGGHQSDRFPTFIFSRQTNRIVPLDRTLSGYINDPNFRIFPSHDVEVFVSDGSTRRIDLQKMTSE